MAESNVKSSQKLFLAVDVGGTKVLAVVVRRDGQIVASNRIPTPSRGRADATLDKIADLMAKTIEDAGAGSRCIAAIGLAVPGVVDPKTGHIVVTPNLNLSNCNVAAPLTKRFGVPVAVGNDANLGILGERWLGAAAGADSAVGIFVGTGIGSGIIQDGRLVTGRTGLGGEIGHMVMQIDGPKCNCGGRGCFEAIASRTAIERQLREAMQAGKRTVLTEIAGQEGRIKSGVLRRALDDGDKLVTSVMADASKVIGLACLNIQHLLEPDVIVLGGGVIEACESFMMPIIRKVVAADPLSGGRGKGRVEVSALGDDTVVLGAAALALQAAGDDPRGGKGDRGDLPKLTAAGGSVIIGDAMYDHDVYVRANGKVKNRSEAMKDAEALLPEQLGPIQLKKMCKGGPQRLIVGIKPSSRLEVTPAATEFLQSRHIDYQVLRLDEAIAAYNKSPQQQAIFLRLGRVS